MTEALWLADFVTRFELTSAVKKHILKRIKSLSDQPAIGMVTKQKAYVPANLPPHIAGQSPSTIANFLKHNPPTTEVIASAPDTEPATPGVVVASQAAAQAMQTRQMAIAAAQSGKPEPGRTSPRKF